jgi:hypothetical protein
MIMSLKKHHIRESHERQFNGEDWQQVAYDMSACRSSHGFWGGVLGERW